MLAIVARDPWLSLRAIAARKPADLHVVCVSYMERMKTRNQGVYTPRPRGRRSFTARLARGVLNLSPLPDAGVATMLGLPKGDSSEGEGDELDEQVLADRKAQAEAAQALGAMRGDADGDEVPESTSKTTARSSARGRAAD